MKMAEMIRRLVEAEASPAVIAVAVEAFNSVSPNVPRDIGDNARDKKRKYERERKRQYRQKLLENNGNAEANDAAIPAGQIRDKKPDVSLSACESSFLPSLLSEEGNREEGKKERANTRARGTRIDAHAELSEDDRKFALDHGIRDPISAWVEFIDYWIGIPGQRGTKLDWSATWRNRVRQLGTKNGAVNGHRPVTGKERLREVIDRGLAEAIERSRGERGAQDTLGLLAKR